MLVVGFDTETTGLNVESDHIIQVGAVLWDTKAPIKKAKMKLDALITLPSHADIDPKASDVNGITREDLDKYGRSFESVMTELHAMFSKAEFVVAHNGNLFDRPIYRANCNRYSVAPSGRPWIDTSCDIEFPGSISTRKLVYLATEHGFINPFPHDAVSDVLTMLKVADCYDWEKTVLWAKSATLTVKAETNFSQKELAKKQNYRWDGDNKMWVKSIKDFQLAEVQKLAQEAGFKVTVLK